MYDAVTYFTVTHPSWVLLKTVMRFYVSHSCLQVKKEHVCERGGSRSVHNMEIVSENTRMTPCCLCNQHVGDKTNIAVWSIGLVDSSS